MGHEVVQLVEALRYNWKFAGSIPDGVIGVCYWHNPSCLYYDPGVDSNSDNFSTLMCDVS